MFAIFAGYQTSLLLGRGFTSGEAGIFASIRCFAGILAQPLLGGWADRHPEVPIKRLLNACLVLALGVNVVFYTTRPGFWGTALIFLTLGILELNAYPLLDSMAVQFIAAGVDMSYSLSRGLGSLSYALACVACGQQAVRFGTESLLLTHMALLVLMIAVVALYPAFPKDALQAQGGGERPHSILYILKSSRPFTLTLVSLFFTLALMLVLLYFMIYRPQKKQEKKDAAMRAALEIGDQVVTIGGIVGRVVAIKEDTFVLETGSDRVKIRFTKNAISSVEKLNMDNAPANAKK